MCQKTDNHAIAFLNDGLSYCLKSPAGSRDDAGLIHVQEFGKIRMEFLNRRPGNLTQPEGLSAVVERWSSHLRGI